MVATSEGEALPYGLSVASVGHSATQTALLVCQGGICSRSVRPPRHTRYVIPLRVSRVGLPCSTVPFPARQPLAAGLLLLNGC